jgi:hypothetical protein
MRTFGLSSKLSASPVQVWDSLAASEVKRNEALSDWPKVMEVSSRSLLFSKYSHKRTVNKTASGCEVTDEVAFESRVQFLGPWLKASEIMKFRRFHVSLRETYGKD